MSIRHPWGFALLALLVLSCVPLQASTFSIFSQDTSVAILSGQFESAASIYSPNLHQQCITAVSVAPDVWATPQGGACWVSFANTGAGATFTVPNNTAAPAALFTDVFTLGGTNDWVGTLTTYADDTTSLYVDGVLITGPSLTLGTYCAANPIGCVGGAGGTGLTIPLTLSPGTHTLRFGAYQLGGDGFGLMYYGSVTETPEPASLMLLGSGLAGLGGLLRRRLR